MKKISLYSHSLFFHSCLNQYFKDLYPCIFKASRFSQTHSHPVNAIKEVSNDLIVLVI